ncbi:MAG TPA: PASTA domain-containing protein [Thermotoga sp.]|nr:PASTA domain-containing protein [Thermotoga sp.]
MKNFFLILSGLILGGVAFLILMYFSIKMSGTISVPNVVGLTPEDAKEILENSHLSYKIIGSGKILRTHPKPEEKVKENRVIKLYCEKQKNVQIPNLVGVQLDMAERILKEYGYNVQKNFFPFKGPDGRVMGMFPEHGNSYSGTITLLVDRGEPEIFERIKDFREMNLENIKTDIKFLKLGQGNLVKDQYPGPGVISSWVILILGR